MADHPVARLGDKTLLQYARPQYMEQLAKEGRTGRLITVPEGFLPVLRLPTLPFSAMTLTRYMRDAVLWKLLL